MVKSSSCAAAALSAPYFFQCGPTWAAKDRSPNDRPCVGAIGLGGRGGTIAQQAAQFGEIVARCDVDVQHLGAEPNGKTHFTDYRKLLERNDIDVVTIGTPDHWHVKIAIDAMHAGKDVYCEKPLTLTIDEGKLITKAVQQTGRVLQVGTQQRSEFAGRFLQAVAMVRAGRVGQLQRVIASTDGGLTGGPFAQAPAPPHLNWDMWLGQAPLVPYTPERCHVNFRWWREYAGGQMTDWGAHHVDIALWAIGLPEEGQLLIEGTGAIPQIENGYNMPAEFHVTCQLPQGPQLQMVTGQRQGILFEGTAGRFFVNRGGIYGKPVDQLRDDPLPEDAITNVYRGKTPGSHMGNFFQCVKSRDLPISDAMSHHRSVTVLHLANLSLLLGRRLSWDLATEQIVGDEEANRMQRRAQRKGYEITA
jgi:predicted dehydrogenase